MDSVAVPRVIPASVPPDAVTEVRLLGPVALLRADGSAVELPSATQRRLVALLALHADKVVRSEALGDTLQLSAGALRKVVSRVRAAVGDALVTSATGYRLVLEVDADRFAAAVLGDRGRADRSAVLASALSRWQGDALDEFAAEPWAIAAATRLDGLRSAAIEELAEQWLAGDRPAEALALLEPHVARTPFADRPRSLLLRALASAGRPADALRAAHRYRMDLRDGVGLVPGPEFREVEQRIATGWDGRPEPVAHRGPLRHELPAPATRRVGPDRFLASVAADLAEHRAVTLTGPGGVGKTRTALESAAVAAARYPDGVVVVELAAVEQPEAVPDAVASALGVAVRDGRSAVASIVERLAGSRLLLVLDNCEHVVAAAASVVRAVVAGCPGVTVLATSRERLGVRGERVVTVRPLDLADAVELFCERACAVDDRAPFEGEELEAVTAICRRLDSLPLAIELAAARSRAMSTADLLARLGRRFDVLGAARDGQYHQRTLWATIDWSYQLLDPDEQLLFDQLSVFRGSFDLAAVEQVCVVPGRAQIELGGLLAALVERSMVLTERTKGDLRYRVLETLRQFAEVGLAERAEEAVTKRRHLHHFVELSEAVDRRWFGPGQISADAEFDREWDNVRVAHGWADAHHEHRLAERLLLATIAHSQSRMRGEHAGWCAASIAAADESGAEPSAALLGWGAWWAMITGELARAVAWSERGLALPASDDDPGAGVCRAVLVFALWTTGRAADAVVRVGELEAVLDRLPPWEAYTGERALFSFSKGEGFETRAARIAAICESIGAPSLLASARFYQGTAQLSGAGAPGRAVAFHLDGIALARGAGAELAECQNLQGLLDAKVALDAPDLVPTCIEALRRMYELRYWLYLWRVLDNAAWLLARAGRLEAAGLLLGHLDRVATPWRSRPRATTRELVSAGGVTAEVLDRGAALDRDAAVHLALEVLADLPAAAS